MILIISTENLEATSGDVMDWLDNYGLAYFRLNGEELHSHSMSYLLGDAEQELQLEAGDCLDLEKVKVVWYRRAGSRSLPTFDGVDNGLSEAIAHYLRGELKVAKTGILQQLADKKWLSKPQQTYINKLYALNIAKASGLSIPKSLVTTSKSSLQEFLKEQQQVIVKSLETPFFYFDEDGWVMQYTHKLDAAFLEQFPEQLFPTLAQEYIEKEYELRIFYFFGQCYSMAIFSQRNAQTAIDFRQYDRETPNRVVPFRLPDDLAEKIKVFMEKAELDTGSLDMIRTREGKYVFLEVNPVGQFGMVSQPCNYFLEKKVADWLGMQATSQ